ncbi:hypothetical protein GN958_ATG22275, partial [Phytophthora infestans]
MCTEAEFNVAGVFELSSRGRRSIFRANVRQLTPSRP